MHRAKLFAWILAGVALLAISGVLAGAAVQPPSQDEIQALEREISMPAGARPVSTYDRYYAAVSQDGRRVIHGIYFGNGGKTTIEASGRLPLSMLDGGCGVVNVYYDVESHKFIRVFCNGVA